MIDFFKNLNEFLANFNTLINELSEPEGKTIKIDFVVTVNGTAIDITMPEQST